jgi:Flp pilus assembly protein TadD
MLDDREARALVKFYLAKTSSKNELLKILRTTPGRSEAVRTKALELAESYWARHLQIQATAYVESLFTQALLKTEIVEAIRKDTKLREDVRTAALIVLEKHPEGAGALASAAMTVAFNRGEKPEAYRRALVQAEAAARERPDEDYIIFTLGISQYRNGQYQQALATLERSDKLNPHFQSEPNAFLAMTYHQLGRKADAQRTLTRLRETMKDPNRARSENARGLLEEAETLLAQPAAPAKK